MSTAYDRLHQDLSNNGQTVTDDGSGRAQAQCPAHDDANPSLSMKRMETQVLVYCHAGCTTEAVTKALGRSMADLYDDGKGAGYIYPNAERVVRRRADKTFSQTGKTKGTRLYRSDRIGDATTVYVAEGEKDVLAIESVGGVAVCSAMGAGKAHLFDWSPLAGTNVVVIADQDDPGRKHALDIVGLVKSIAASVKVVEARVGKDAADHIAAGHGLDEFVDVPDAGPAFSATAAGVKADEDPEPSPLVNRVTIPPFPVDALPTAIRDMVRALAEATQTDPAMAGTSALSCLSACTGGHAEVEVRSGWHEPLCLYLATVAAPGERKSAVQHAMVSPIYDVEHDLVDKGMGLRMEQEARKQVAQKAAERARNTAASASGDKQDAAMADAIGASQLADSIDVPVTPRLVADDASLLAEQGGRLAIISAEGGVFDIIAGRYSKSVPNMDIWLKGHSGDPIKVDRKGREPEYIRRPALTLGLMIQPTVLTNLAANRDFRGRGFLARILYSYPVSKVGSRRIATTPVSVEIRAAYELAVQELAHGMVEWADDPAVLILTPAAQAAIQDIERAVEPTLVHDGELAALADWGAKYVGAVFRIAGILHLAKYGSEVGPKSSVDEVTVTEAVAIGEFFKASAINAFIDMGMDSSMADAVYLLERINAAVGLGEEQSTRDLHRLTMSRFKTVADLRPALEKLIDYGWLFQLERPQTESTGGRPPSPRYRIWSA